MGQWFVIHHRPGHGKTLGLPRCGKCCADFLISDTFRAPQFIAAGLLLVYLLQCVWLVRAQALHGAIPDVIGLCASYQGLEQWKGGAIAGTPESLRSEMVTGLPSAGRSGHLRVLDGYDQDRSPLYYLIAAAPLLLRPGSWLPESLQPLVAVSPYLFFGLMLGASLWYVARRLYGNAGGYIALALYCFSPAMIVNVAGTQSLGEMGACLGSVRNCLHRYRRGAHALCSPRSCVLELAAHSAAGVVSGAGGGQPVFAGSASAGGLAADVLGRAGASARRARDLDHGSRRRIGVAVCRLFFSACVVLARNAACALDGFRVWRRLV